MTDRPTNASTPRGPEEFDPANQALADALRKSFRLLKWIMIGVLILYVFSGLFRIAPGEVGYVLRMGRIVQSDLQPGWHWSLPFPIDDAKRIPLQGERDVTASFMFTLSDAEKMQKGPVRSLRPLQPGRDYFLITGDLNILHAELKAQYVIDSAADYLTHVAEQSPGDKDPPEAEILHQLLSASAIEMAATRGVDAVYKDRATYLNDVAERMIKRLDDLRARGAPLGIRIRRVVATSFHDQEAIMPPGAVVTEFEAVQAAEQRKGQTISEARGKAVEMLSRAAGPNYTEIVEAINAEFQSQRDKSPDLPRLREKTESLLLNASGEVRTIIKDAELMRDSIIAQANGDAAKVRSMAGDYQRIPDVLVSRLRQDMIQRLLSNPHINKRYIPPGIGKFWIDIGRSPEQQQKAAEQAKKDREASSEKPGGPTRASLIRPQKAE